MLENCYSLYSLVKKRGGGKLIVKEVFKKLKKHHLNRLVTLSPLTEMARKFHLNNGAFEVQVNDDTQNLNINYNINFDKSVSLTNSLIFFLI